jgi:hypothetical protein
MRWQHLLGSAIDSQPIQSARMHASDLRTFPMAVIVYLRSLSSQQHRSQNLEAWNNLRLS